MKHHETTGICDPAIQQIPIRIVANNTSEVDIVSGATKTSNGIKNAVISCLNQAKGKEPVVEPPREVRPVPLNYSYYPGVYGSMANGYYGEVQVEVTLSDSIITGIKVVGYPKTEYGNERVPEAIEGGIIDKMLKFQTYEVDTVSGATFTSDAIIEAVKDCVEKAKK